MTLRLDINITGLDRIADAVLALAGGACESNCRKRLNAEATSTAVPVPATAPTAQTPSAVPVAPAPAAPAVPAPVAPAPAAVPTAQAAPAPVVPAPVAAPAPAVAPAPMAAPSVPTAPVQAGGPSYSMDDLAAAAITLMDSGRMNDLQALLRSFGVEALPNLPKEKYGAFATALRGMGARI